MEGPAYPQATHAWEKIVPDDVFTHYTQVRASVMEAMAEQVVPEGEFYASGFAGRETLTQILDQTMDEEDAEFENVAKKVRLLETMSLSNTPRWEGHIPQWTRDLMTSVLDGREPFVDIQPEPSSGTLRMADDTLRFRTLVLGKVANSNQLTPLLAYALLCVCLLCQE